ncbi:hypothetical protein C8R42DRAFT_717411 [Lentinula raphanica]|nr:hypothetical protein C8R42DRAFT_717411 [Lentinula raphanica]
MLYLKPLPANHHLAHTTICILGKLGGHNRKLLAKEPALEYKHHSDDPTITIAFLGIDQQIPMQPGVVLAHQNLAKGSTIMAVPAYDFVEAVLSSLVDQGIRGHKAEELLVHTLLHILKDLPADLPEDVDGIIKVLKEVLKIGSSNISFHLDAATQPQTRSKLIALVSVFFPELQSAIPVIRQASQACIDFLVQIIVEDPPLICCTGYSEAFVKKHR